MIAEFSKFLPAECEYQEDAEAEAAEEAVEYYDEEVSDPEDKYSSEEEQPEEEKKNEESESAIDFNPKENAESTAAETDKEEGQKPSEGQGGFFTTQLEEDDGKDFEYDSDYDEQGKYIWGDEGEDWDFYYDEDKEAFELGLPTVPEPLNPSALP